MKKTKKIINNNKMITHNSTFKNYKLIMKSVLHNPTKLIKYNK